MVDENDIHKIISVNQAIPVVGSTNHSRRFNALRTSSKNNETPSETKTTLALQKPSPAPLSSKKTYTEDQKDSNMRQNYILHSTKTPFRK